MCTEGRETRPDLDSREGTCNFTIARVQLLLDTAGYYREREKGGKER